MYITSEERRKCLNICVVQPVTVFNCSFLSNLIGCTGPAGLVKKVIGEKTKVGKERFSADYVASKSEGEGVKGEKGVPINHNAARFRLCGGPLNVGSRWGDFIDRFVLPNFEHRSVVQVVLSDL